MITPAQFLDEHLALTNPYSAKEQRIREIERALKLDPDRAYRKQLVSEFLDLTNPEPKKDADL